MCQTRQDEALPAAVPTDVAVRCHLGTALQDQLHLPVAAVQRVRLVMPGRRGRRMSATTLMPTTIVRLSQAPRLALVLTRLLLKR